METGGNKPVDDSTPVSTGTSNELKSSIDTRFDELKNLILNLPSRDIPSAQPPPADPNSKSQKDGNLEEGEEEQENDDKSNASHKPKPSKGNGSRKFSAVPGPNYMGPALPSPHYAHVGNPPMLDASSFANWQF